jgi:hypothetical protein
MERMDLPKNTQVESELGLDPRYLTLSPWLLQQPHNCPGGLQG